jgi:peroxiredoxin
MKQLSRFLMLLLFMAVAAIWAAGGKLSGRRAPGFCLPDVNMKLHDLADYRGKTVLLEIMQTNCPHCRDFAKVLKEIKAKYGDQLVVLSVVNPPDTLDSVKRFIAEMKWTTPMLFDCGQMAASYMMVTPQNPVMSIPHIFIIDRNGWIQKDFGYESANKGIFEGQQLFSELEPFVSDSGSHTKPGRSK